MKSSVFFVAVTFLLFAQIFSAPTTQHQDSPTSESVDKTTTAAANVETTQPPPSPPVAVTQDQHNYIDNELKVNTSNPMLGDIPIIPDHNNVEIINRRYVPLRNCKELLDSGFDKSGLYVVQPGAGGEFVVYCDMTLLGGGWTVIQRRLNGDTEFDNKYAAYKNGFGDFAENFWLGLDKISRLSQQDNLEGTMEVYFGMQAFFEAAYIASSTYSRYSSFAVGTEADGYRLKISGHTSDSTAGDSMSSHNNQKFSAKDNDQDSHNSQHCARRHKGGWWYKNCLDANLNGKYYESGHNLLKDGISWASWLTEYYSLKSTLIAIRPRD